MCNIVTVGEAVVTPEIAETLARMQANDNEDLHNMAGNINELKRFLISLNGSDQEPAEILGVLGDIQYIEDYLKGLTFNSKANNHEK